MEQKRSIKRNKTVYIYKSSEKGTWFARKKVTELEANKKKQEVLRTNMII